MLAWTNKINLPAPLKFTENERNSPSHSLFQNNWTKSIYDDKVLLLSLKKLAVSPIYGVCAKLRQHQLAVALKVHCVGFIYDLPRPLWSSGELKPSTAPGTEANLTMCPCQVIHTCSKSFQKLTLWRSSWVFFFLASQQPLRDSFHYETLSHLVQ